MRQHALQLFRDLQTVHELPPEYGSWLEASAMMRDVGKFMNYQGHHRHAQYIIANSELSGFTPQQRGIMGGHIALPGQVAAGGRRSHHADDSS